MTYFTCLQSAFHTILWISDGIKKELCESQFNRSYKSDLHSSRVKKVISLKCCHRFRGTELFKIPIQPSIFRFVCTKNLESTVSKYNNPTTTIISLLSIFSVLDCIGTLLLFLYFLH